MLRECSPSLFPEHWLLNPTVKPRPSWSVGIYQEVDGFYYYDPYPLGAGSYSAHTLREIADKLDELNKPWSDQIDRELKLKP